MQLIQRFLSNTCCLESLLPTKPINTIYAIPFHSLAPGAGTICLFAQLGPWATAPYCTNKSVLHKDTLIDQAVPRSILGVLENSSSPSECANCVVDT